MFLELSNAPLPYAWGSTGGIAAFTGGSPGGGPEAELWFGTHEKSPTATPRRLPDGMTAHKTLVEWILAEPEAMLGRADARELPILLKVLSAAAPLSLQVHPNATQALAGHADERAGGGAIDPRLANYPDSNPKPELIVAVSETFVALSGFRPPAELQYFIDVLLASSSGVDRESIRQLSDSMLGRGQASGAVRWLTSGDVGVARCVTALSGIAERRKGMKFEDASTLATVRELAEHYPNDPGVVIATLMNRVELSRGQCLFTPPGVLHAYLSGTGVELMTASDNVVRGGLTHKRIDKRELLRLVSFEQSSARLLEPNPAEPGIHEFRPPAPFSLTVIASGVSDVTRSFRGPAIVLVETGHFSLRGKDGMTALARGSAVFVPFLEDSAVLSGHGNAWIAACS